MDLTSIFCAIVDDYCRQQKINWNGKKNLKSEFPKAVSYNRFVELMPNALTVIDSFLSNSCLEKCSGISFIDSTILKV
ncbi:transposase [Leptospira kirschneri]|uniref:transposase n=1 Tax=Leptospira kirschneri TaxID=29507 RepID=UPI0002BF36A1|nr:hypothetical protein LEP1GSC198_1096 [Leptospira kirschneri str. JB]EMK02994.1 hypothetical protein LEP1GSC166_0127 [Leptospira kirschneri]KXZ24500.1 transposase [Leptospira kirschneri]KXZ26208.1 transposase [Leptospira sp. ZV016]